MPEMKRQKEKEKADNILQVAVCVRTYGVFQ
jgi:hypothetical protein